MIKTNYQKIIKKKKNKLPKTKDEKTHKLKNKKNIPYQIAKSFGLQVHFTSSTAKLDKPQGWDGMGWGGFYVFNPKRELSSEWICNLFVE